MGSLQNPIGNGPRDPFEKPLRIEPIEEDKLAKNDKQKEPETGQKNEKLGIASYLLQILDKTVDFLLGSNATNAKEGLTLRENLTLLRAALETMKSEDRSQDVDFLNNLSKIWRFAIENAMQFKNDTAHLKFKVLVKKFQHYPENQPHSFGYYLVENANQKWVPFPYMELVMKIHTEHKKNPELSTLTEWSSLIDEILSFLKDE